MTHRGEYWYNPKTGKVWPYDGTYGGDDKFVKLVEASSSIIAFELWLIKCYPRMADTPDMNTTDRTNLQDKFEAAEDLLDEYRDTLGEES